MNHGSLFSGIGGFDLAASWMGWTNVFHCEKEKFCQRILNYYWPEATLHDDIKTTDFTIYRGRIDIISGGFPCQPYSAAGKRKGTEDDRHLWPEMLRAIREIQPTWIVGENVRGLTNWNGGMVFDQVQADLEAESYEVLPFLLPACAVNAPHRRDRIWFVAYAQSNRIRRLSIGERKSNAINGINGKNGITPDTRLQRQKISEQQATGIKQCDKRNASDTDSIRYSGKEYWQTESGQFTETNTGRRWQDFPTQPPVCSRDDEFSSQLDGITFPKWRNESIKGFGNAVVPELVLMIFKAIENYNTQ